MSSRRPPRLLHAASLLAMLLFAQTAALAHAELPKSHPAHDVCALCASLATFGAGNVSAPPVVHVAAPRSDGVEYLPSHRPDRRIERRFARGPPQPS